MYKENEDAKVTLLVSSLGGPISLHFLNNIVDQEWKDTYIDTYIPLSAAFAYGSHIIHILLSGPIILTGTSVDINIDRRVLDRTLPVIYWLLLHASVWKDTILVVTPTRNYTVNDYEDLFTDAGVTVILTSPLFGIPVQHILGLFAPPCNIFLGYTVSLMVPLGKY